METLCPSLGQIGTVMIAGALSYLILVPIYRLTVHPLAKYPGPLFGRISDWSIPLQASRGDRHLQTWKSHEKYGSVVRIGPNVLSINTISALKEIYASRKANVQKSDWYLTIDAQAKALSTHSEIDKNRHAFRRRVLDHAFSDSALRSAETFVVDNVKTWCRHLGDSSGDKSNEWTMPKNMSTWSTYLTYDIMGDLTFGTNFGCMERETNRYVLELMMSSVAFVYMLGYLPIISLIRPLMGTWVMDLIGGKLARDGLAYTLYANEQMDQRIERHEKDEIRTSSTEARKDLAHYLIESRDPQSGRGLTTNELRADSGLLISAGSDTTSVTLSAAYFYLLHNSSKLAKVEQEVRTTFKSSSEIRGPAVSTLVYLRACVDETLRRAPAVPSQLPREVLPGGLRIDEHHLPAGCVVGTAPYAIHHNAEYYPDPFAFRPERWIVDSEADVTQASVDTARAAFCPFSLGPRGCIGKRVAYLEVMLALAMALFELDVRLAAGEPSGKGGLEKRPGRLMEGEYQLFDHFVAGRDGPMVQFKRRVARFEG